MDNLARQKKREWKRTNRAKVRLYLEEYKSAHTCLVCGENRACCLVFHHRDSSTKKFTICYGRDKAFNLIVAEVAKCNVMCANCHLELHINKRLKIVADKPEDDNWLFD